MTADPSMASSKASEATAPDAAAPDAAAPSPATPDAAAPDAAAPSPATPGSQAAAPPAARPGFLARQRRKLMVLAGLVVGVPLLHLGLQFGTRIEPPPIAQVTGEREVKPDGMRVLGRGYARQRGKILEVRLAGTPEEIGHQHGRLLREEMIENEGMLHAEFERFVPLAPLRWLLMDLSRLQFRRVDGGMPLERRREIAAHAAAFSPDPFADRLPTYHRMVFLHALYDISLSFEHSPLIGCTSFALSDGAFEGGGAVLARAFDFEVLPIFDEKKAVFLMHEEGRIPYASVSWPGLAGAVSGMNAEGLAAVVHGGRGSRPQVTGQPMAHTMRELLGRARTVDEALALLATTDPMVSHMIFLGDASGSAAVAERAPGVPLHARRGRGKVPLTNHFEGPLGADPANRRVMQETSSLARRARLDELLAGLPASASVEQVVGVLRDRKGVGGADLPLGDRRAIDALIATHGVVMDTTRRALWVSESPHLLGRFVRFDLKKLLDPAFTPGGPGDGEDVLQAVPEDPALTDGAYDAWVRAGARHTNEQGESPWPDGTSGPVAPQHGSGSPVAPQHGSGGPEAPREGSEAR
ncbi:C45 family autoproteolytic acyltransferase/hydolase [Chondromyces crocatus]|uniref:Peptidase C45 hydrolase domain-containing protein n=1 Tax=Chondromyces crocatus TaxID=52 RepID=A0A0K1E8P5_CHOCO|nr:C45 family peptidase [Chondromyces crocatus]AKT37230.1 uncharacterized protein CMC5_013610 [Chondromyces crocatus]